jgi:16S rRNA (cytosine1402-N4)-methyltransferase
LYSQNWPQYSLKLQKISLAFLKENKFYTNKMAEYHIPVLFDECLESLNINPNGVYIDATFGGGGHSKGILDKLGPSGKLYSFDQDADAKVNAEAFKDDSRFTFIAANFRHMAKYLRMFGVQKVDGILADLGVSSFQIDEPTRGFSTRFNGPLDMRMNRASELSAYQVINTYPEKELHKIFGIYGEVKNAKTLANAVFAARTGKKIDTIAEFKQLLSKYSTRGKENKYLAQVFQAIRIEVNQELEALKEFLLETPNILAPEGRLCVISFHSLEDRLVKNFIRSGKFSGDIEKDFYGHEIRPLEAVSRKPIVATDEEMVRNGRSRSAKLRIAEMPNSSKN